MLPVEILEEIFAYLSRDDLDHCEIICLKWSKIIETAALCQSKRLTQRRFVSLDYYCPYGPWKHETSWVELKSSTGKTFRFYDDPNQQKLSAFPVFKNVIIMKLVENCLYSINDLDSLEERLMKIFKLAGVRIIVKFVYLNLTALIRKIGHDIILKRLHDLLTKYIDADEITMAFYHRNEILLNKELWKYFNFGKKTEFNFYYYAINSTNDVPNETFKEFISGKHMEHPKLNELEIYFCEIDRHVIFHLIVKTFCNTDEPFKFFKSIKTYPPENFDEIFGEFGFVREDRDPQKYRLSHPKLKWALEATHPPQKYGFQMKCMPVEL